MKENITKGTNKKIEWGKKKWQQESDVLDKTFHNWLMEKKWNRASLSWQRSTRKREKLPNSNSTLAEQKLHTLGNLSMIYTERRPGMNWFLCINVFLCIKVYVRITVDSCSTCDHREAERSSTEKYENCSTCSFTLRLKKCAEGSFNLWLFSRFGISSHYLRAR